MPLLVIGTLAYDTVETPFDRRERALGGSAVYFAMAASMFGPLRLAGVIGEDFDEAHLELLRARGVDTAGVERIPGKSFHWGGRCAADWNTRTTLFTHLNVIEHFHPKLPKSFCDSRDVFLANAEPKIQLEALEQCPAFASSNVPRRGRRYTRPAKPATNTKSSRRSRAST